MGVIYWAWWGGIKMGDSTLHRMGEELPKIAFCRKNVFQNQVQPPCKTFSLWMLHVLGKYQMFLWNMEAQLLFPL